MSKEKKSAFNNYNSSNANQSNNYSDYYKNYLYGADYYDELANEFESLVRNHKEEHKNDASKSECQNHSEKNKTK